MGPILVPIVASAITIAGLCAVAILISLFWPIALAIWRKIK